MQGQLVRVTVGGHAIVELIGAHATPGQITIDDLPGTFALSSIGRTGVSVLLPGCKPIGLTPITDTVVPANSRPIPTPFPAAGVADINIQAIATDATGQTYGFNVFIANNAPVVQLLTIDNTTGAATVVAELAGLPVPADLVSIEASAFDPGSGLLYFVGANGANNAVVDQLYTVDVGTFAVTAIPGTFREVANAGPPATAAEPRRIRGMAFDQIDATTSRLLVLTTEGNAANGNNRIIVVDPANTDTFTAFANVTTGAPAAPMTTLTDITVVRDDPTQADDVIYAVSSAGANSGLYTVNIATAAVGGGNALATLAMILPDRNDTVAPIRGQNLQSLTWNPTLIDPSSGALGLLLATDTISDELVYIPLRTSSADELYSIYVAQANPGDSISVAVYHVDANNAYLTPFDGASPVDAQGRNTVVATSDNRYGLQIANAQNGQTTTVTFAAGMGGVYIGVHGFNTANPPQRVVPVISAALANRIGTRPVGLDDLALDATNNIAAGVTVAPSLLDYLSASLLMGDRLMGMNLDQIAGMAVRRDLTLGDSIVVVDVDGVGTNGLPGAPVQLATISPGTGRATRTVPISLSSLGDVVAGFGGMGFSDVNFSGNEDLYAILRVTSPGPVTVPMLGIIDTTSGVFQGVGALDSFIPNQIVALAFSPRRRLSIGSGRTVRGGSRDRPGHR